MPTVAELLVQTLAEIGFLAAPGPAILHACVAADELPVMPHIDRGMAAKYGLAKFKEIVHRRARAKLKRLDGRWSTPPHRS